LKYNKCYVLFEFSNLDDGPILVVENRELVLPGDEDLFHGFAEESEIFDLAALLLRRLLRPDLHDDSELGAFWKEHLSDFHNLERNKSKKQSQGKTLLKGYF